MSCSTDYCAIRVICNTIRLFMILFRILKSDVIEFVPPLPAEKLLAIRNIGSGCLNKVIIQFDECFFPVDQYTYGYVSPLPGYYPMIINATKQVIDQTPTLGKSI